MQCVKIRENVYWVGAVDEKVRMFHGYQTPYGTSYNAFLVLDEKITLIDTVKAPFTQTFWDTIAQVVPPEKIDIVITNHVEPDHSGALPYVAQQCPNAEIYISPNGEKGVKAYYASLQDRPMHVVSTGDTLCTGAYTFEFLLMPMVHWPDSMATYLREEKILFSNDAFGQHIAGKERFDDELSYDNLLERVSDYYANIILPFGKQVQKVLASVAGLEIEIICPSHGVLLRSFIPEILERYAAWSKGTFCENKAVIVYDSMWGSTEEMAQRLEQELQAQGKDTVIFSLSQQHHSQVMGDILEANYICVGSSTLNRTMLPTVAAFLCYLKGLNPQNRIGMAFGAYGWSGESVAQVEDVLSGMGYELLPAQKVKWKL